MGNWGIADTAPEKEKIKSEMADHLHGLNCTGMINYPTYSEMFDFTMALLDKMYALGAAETRKAVLAEVREWLRNKETGGNIVIDPLEMWSLLAEMEGDKDD